MRYPVRDNAAWDKFYRGTTNYLEGRPEEGSCRACTMERIQRDQVSPGFRHRDVCSAHFCVEDRGEWWYCSEECVVRDHLDKLVEGAASALPRAVLAGGTRWDRWVSGWDRMAQAVSAGMAGLPATITTLATAIVEEAKLVTILRDTAGGHGGLDVNLRSLIMEYSAEPRVIPPGTEDILLLPRLWRPAPRWRDLDWRDLIKNARRGFRKNQANKNAPLHPGAFTEMIRFWQV